MENCIWQIFTYMYYQFCFQPAVLDNLLGSMKYVLTGMGLLRINLENAKNRVFIVN